MEWYPESCVDTTTIANDQEWLPSPNSLCQWETGPPPQNLEWLDSGAGEFCQQIGNQVGMTRFTVSDTRNIWGKDISSDHTDFQLDNLEGIGRPNDMILPNSSSSEASGVNKKFHTSFCMGSSGCQCEGWPVDSFCSQAINLSTQVQSMDSSDCCNSYFLSPSISLENETAAESLHHVPSCVNEHDEANSQAKVPVVKIVVPCNYNDHHRSIKGGEATVEEISVEESVLQGLEMVTSQLTEETRICFRDALYRLADNSRRQQLATSQNQQQGSKMGDDSSPPLVSSQHNNNKRNKRTTERRRAKESETNIIDRTVAKIMFDRVVYFAGCPPNDFSAQEEEEEEEEEDMMFGKEHQEMCVDSSSNILYQSHDDTSHHFQVSYNFGSVA